MRMTSALIVNGARGPVARIGEVGREAPVVLARRYRVLPRQRGSRKMAYRLLTAFALAPNEPETLSTWGA